MKSEIIECTAAAFAGAVTGILGAGGGMVLVPLLSMFSKEHQNHFSTSLLLMIPICLVSLLVRLPETDIPWDTACLYLVGSGVGGLAAGRWGHRIPILWLHRVFCVMILWGGIRFLWN